MKGYQQIIQVHSWQNNPQHTSCAQMGTGVNCVICLYGREHTIILITVYWALLGTKNRDMWLLGTGTNIPLASFAMWFYFIFFLEIFDMIGEKRGCQNLCCLRHFGKGRCIWPMPHSDLPSSGCRSLWSCVIGKKKQNRQPHSVFYSSFSISRLFTFLNEELHATTQLGWPKRPFP